MHRSTEDHVRRVVNRDWSEMDDEQWTAKYGSADLEQAIADVMDDYYAHMED